MHTPGAQVKYVHLAAKMCTPGAGCTFRTLTSISGTCIYQVHRKEFFEWGAYYMYTNSPFDVIHIRIRICTITKSPGRYQCKYKYILRKTYTLLTVYSNLKHVYLL